MEIKRPKQDDEPEDVDSLPGNDEQVPEKPNREHELELELAEKRGELKALKNIPTNNGQMSLEQTKQVVYADSNNMTDEDFQTKYKQSKHAAIMTVMDADSRQSKAEAKQLHAEASAAAELSAKYGQEFYRFKEKILEDVGDLADGARQDSQKLTKWMERQFLALSRDNKVTSKKPDDRRKVADVKDFEKPAIQQKREELPPIENEDDIKDEIPAESDISNQKLAHFMGIRSEKERKTFADKNLIYVDMDLTGKDPYANGEKLHFGDPKKGFERIKSA